MNDIESDLTQKHSRIFEPMTRMGKAVSGSGSRALRNRALVCLRLLPGNSYYGLGTTGMGHPVSWAFYLVNFVFFIGISHAGALVSAVLRITHARWGTPLRSRRRGRHGLCPRSGPDEYPL